VGSGHFLADPNGQNVDQSSRKGSTLLVIVISFSFEFNYCEMNNSMKKKKKKKFPWFMLFNLLLLNQSLFRGATIGGIREKVGF